MVKGFWKSLPAPIIAQSPMDGVTDAACRYITDKYGSPAILFTEFTSVEGISYGADKLLYAFVHHQTKTPTVAQIFGADPEAFYKVALILGEMGFDGIDINMGCPDSHISKKGGGAGLIRTPDVALQIIQKTRQGIQDWAAGKTMKEVGLKPAIISFVEAFQKKHNLIPEKKELPVSVKTRMGYDEIVTRDWISTLLSAEPVTISLHGRTLKQMYTGKANWDEIAVAAQLAHKTETKLLGNGDITSYADALEKIKTYGTDGALIGRASFGNPWIFKGEEVDPKTRLSAALEHAKAFMDLTPELHFLALRKHLAWYTKGFDHSAEVRVRFMQTQSVEDIEKTVAYAYSIIDGQKDKSAL